MKDYQKIRRIATEDQLKSDKTTGIFCDVYTFIIYLELQFALDPPKILTGSIINTERKAKSPLIVMPMMRKGSVRSHTIGYRTNANNANGQHRKRRIIQRINVDICYLRLIVFHSLRQRW